MTHGGIRAGRSGSIYVSSLSLTNAEKCRILAGMIVKDLVGALTIKTYNPFLVKE